jgi:hypothetical protein
VRPSLRSVYCHASDAPICRPRNLSHGNCEGHVPPRCRRPSKNAHTRPIENRVFCCVLPLELPTGGQRERPIQSAATPRIPDLSRRARYRVQAPRAAGSTSNRWRHTSRSGPRALWRQGTATGPERSVPRDSRACTETTGRGFRPVHSICGRPIRSGAPTNGLPTDGHRLLAVYGLARGRVWADLRGR